MCPIYTSCFTAPVSRFFSTGVGDTTIFYWDEIERKSVSGVLHWDMLKNELQLIFKLGNY